VSGRAKRTSRAYLGALEEIASIPLPRFLRHYVLDGRSVRLAINMLEAIGGLPRPHVGLNTIGGVGVSTVFLGIDHSHGRPGGPILFETMIFGGGVALDGLQRRYRTFDEAEAGHAEIVARVRAAVNR
jgi:hypothetical protein